MDIKAYLNLVREYTPNLPAPQILDFVVYKPELTNDGGSQLGLPDENEGFRNAVSAELYRTYSLDDLAFIKYLLDQMIKSRKAWRGGREIDLVAFMLFQFGRVEDVFQLYQAKFSGGMDTLIGLDHELLLGAGLEKTQQFLRQIDTEKSLEIIGFIDAYYDPSRYGSLERYKEAMKDYYSDLIE